MNTTRLEAFSDGVIAIIITIMVLELKVPHGETFAALAPLLPVFLGYVLSFLYVGIYWNNHHHMLHAVEKVSGPILWANLHLLFWLSLFPVTTAWVGENHSQPAPSALYGAVLFMASIAYWILKSAMIRAQGGNSLLEAAVGADFKGKVSSLIYLVGIGLSLWRPAAGQCLYAATALWWLIPDRRIERTLAQAQRDAER